MTFHIRERTCIITKIRQRWHRLLEVFSTRQKPNDLASVKSSSVRSNIHSYMPICILRYLLHAAYINRLIASGASRDLLLQHININHYVGRIIKLFFCSRVTLSKDSLI